MGPFSDLSAEGFRGVTVALVERTSALCNPLNFIHWCLEFQIYLCGKMRAVPLTFILDHD